MSVGTPTGRSNRLNARRPQIAAGADPDFHRRDMADGIEAGAPLEFGLTKQYTGKILEAVGLHRVWERAELVMAE